MGIDRLARSNCNICGSVDIKSNLKISETDLRIDSNMGRCRTNLDDYFVRVGMGDNSHIGVYDWGGLYLL